MVTHIIKSKHLHHFYIGLGNYKLLPQFDEAAISEDELSLITCYSPEEVVDHIIEGKTSFTNESRMYEIAKYTHMHALEL